MKLLITNQSKHERIIRAIIAVILLGVALLMNPGTLQIAYIVIAGILIFNAVSGTCYIYRVFGFSTN